MDTVAKRTADDAVFGKLVPDEVAIEQIHGFEKGRWYLVATRSGYDQSSLDLHRVLELQGEVMHYQLSARDGNQTIPLNCYFMNKYKEA